MRHLSVMEDCERNYGRSAHAPKLTPPRLPSDGTFLCARQKKNPKQDRRLGFVQVAPLKASGRAASGCREMGDAAQPSRCHATAAINALSPLANAQA